MQQRLSLSVALGPTLIEHSLLSESQLAQAIEASRKANSRLDQTLVEMAFLTTAQLADVAVLHMGVRRYAGETAYDAGIASSYMRDKSVIPLRGEVGEPHLGMVDIFDDFTFFSTMLRMGPVAGRVLIAQDEFFALCGDAGRGDANSSDYQHRDRAGIDEDDMAALREIGSTEPVVQFMRMIVSAAVSRRASDIHLRSGYRSASALLRIDGRLEMLPAPSQELLGELVSRLKVLAKLDISERRLPQDGRLRLVVSGQQVDFRLSTMPHLHGEGAVLRLLSKDTSSLRIESLGFGEPVAKQLVQVAQWKSGLFLVAGPTGSGKTTTLYAIVNQLLRPEINVVSVEDPVEYRLEGMAQIQIDDRSGLTFARALRSVLRQDPNVILVGEIRDAETAQIAVQAALTGHFVLASLHADSASKCVPRLVDMGVEPYLVRAVLKGALSQRLVPDACPECSGDQDRCPECGGSGYSGRHPEAEIVFFGDLERPSHDHLHGPDWLTAETYPHG